MNTATLVCLLTVNVILVAAVIYLAVRTHMQDRGDFAQLLRAFVSRNGGEFGRLEQQSRRPVQIPASAEAEFEELRRHMAMVAGGYDEQPVTPEGI